jgi:hypothetical protein
MNGPSKQFTVIQEDDAFIVGKLEDQTDSGVYLTTESLQRLREVIAATKTRLNALGSPALPDALKNLLGILDRLLAAHHEHLTVEFESGPNQQAYEQAQEELKKAIEALKGFNSDDDGPKRA